MRYLVRALIKYNASDLHIKVGRPPMFRINGNLIPVKMPEFTQEMAENLIYGILTRKQIADLEKNRQISTSFVVQDLGRFRCNVYFQRGTVSAAVRMIPLSIPSLEQLGIPSVMKELCQRPRGLLLVTGASGAGKSTTLASLLQYINENHQVHVLAIEDPIEFLHRDIKASITQREIGSDTPTLQDGLQAALRQDPDVIMIGELLDKEMIQAALTAAETGHLVMATLHTNDVKGTLSRILDVFPPEGQHQIRIQLAATLVGVISQQLLIRADGTGRVPACEIMVKSPMIQDLIIQNKVDQIPDVIATSNSYYKMQTMNQALERLVRAGIVQADEALKCSGSPDDLKLILAGIDRGEGYEKSDGRRAS